MKVFFRSKKVLFAAAALVSILLLLVAFRAGELVGYRKAVFTYGWQKSYGQIFGMPRFGFFHRPPPGERLMNAHGVAGLVLKAGAGTLVIEGNDSDEKSVIVATTTVVRLGSSAVSAKSILPGEGVVVIGDPTDAGEIEARFIRVFATTTPLP